VRASAGPLKCVRLLLLRSSSEGADDLFARYLRGSAGGFHLSGQLLVCVFGLEAHLDFVLAGLQNDLEG